MKSIAVVPPAVNGPAYDEIYERILREHFAPTPVGDDFVKGVMKRFRAGPLTLCSHAIGVWVNKNLLQRHWTQQQLADRIGVDRSTVAVWISGGTITIGNLVQILLEFNAQWPDLPLPARQEMALEGYLAALGHIREQVRPDGEPQELDRERFWCLYHLFSKSHWDRALRRQDADLLAEEVVRILRAAEDSNGRRPTAILGVEGLKRLVAEWGVAWLVCIKQIPRAWSVQ